MKAILINEDNTLSWSDVPDPVLTAGKVIIEIHAVGLNRADLLQRAGNYPPPDGWPAWMGLEAAGVVSAVGPDSRWSIGDRVCALMGGGAYAEYASVPEEMLVPVPDGLSLVEAASIPETFATSYLNLCIEGGMKKGDSVFIQAGASGLGISAIQLAKHVGATVITSVGSDEKAAFVREIGADIIINRKKESIVDVLAKYPVDIALDCVAGPQLGPCLETMKPSGRWIIIATLGGSTAEIDMLQFFKRGIKLIGSTLRSRSTTMKGEILQALQKTIWPSFSSGTIKTVIHKTLPITEAECAHEILQRNENIGKVILTVQGII